MLETDAFHDSAQLKRNETERLRLRSQLHTVCAEVHDNEECKQTVSDLLGVGNITEPCLINQEEE